jgi:hypothetical protein
VDQVVGWIFQHWWLVFPFMGVLGAAGSAWERGARRRHKRRLEVLHAKAELKAAQAAARGGTVAAASLPPVTAATAAGSVPGSAEAPDTQTTQLERLFATHDAVTARWLEYELDVAKMIAFPAMSDGRQPLTAAFLRAKRVADELRPESPKTKLTKEQLAEYRSAVVDFEVAFDVAERDARRLKDSSFSEGERKRLDTAKQLLTIAVDQAATPAERQLAYRRVREELDGLIAISDDAIDVLEKKVMLELAPSESAADSTDAATPATGEAAQSAASPAPASAPAEEAASGGEASPAPWPVPARPAADPGAPAPRHKPLS